MRLPRHFLLFFVTNVQLRGKELSFSSLLSFLFILFHLNKKLPRRSVEAGVADRMEEMLPFTKKFCLPFDIHDIVTSSQNDFFWCHILDISYPVTYSLNIFLKPQFLAYDGVT